LLHVKSERKQFDVGGVLLDRPFRIRRLGHVGLNCRTLEKTAQFYVETLGFRISDKQHVADFAPPQLVEKLRKAGDAYAYLLRHNTEHHTFFLTSWSVINEFAPALWNYCPHPERTVSQISWQVGSLQEVVEAWTFLPANGVKPLVAGRDMPGSNWHAYTQDPEGNINELFYGMEQVGWLGLSKPSAMYDRSFAEAPSLPQTGEWAEVDAARARGVIVTSGYRQEDSLEAPYDVDGVLMSRPFKIVRVGPIGIYSEDVEARIDMYRDTYGLRLTERSRIREKYIGFLRANTEHHSLAVVPLELRSALGLGSHSRMAWVGFQLATYRQLKAAVAFLRERGHQVIDDIDPALHAGIDRVALTFDPEGHCIMLYSGMEQIGSDGHVRERNARTVHSRSVWPETLDAEGNEFCGEPYLGPLA
jgi:catechol 2,3-dioxygenase-like lactoylglutathione lyase family enzyme